MQRIVALLSAVLLSAGLMAVQTHAQQDPAQQDPGQESSAAQPQASAQDFTDEQLEQFVAAAQSIAAVSQDYTLRLQEAEGEHAQQEEVRTQANEEMVRVVEEHGLDVDTFNDIGEAIQEDPELMKRVQVLVQESDS